MANPTDISRKAGDTMVIKGILEADNLPASAAWAGAVAKINIMSVGGAVIVNHGNVTLDVNTRAFEYKGAALTEGAYYYEIEVTFTDGTVLTWPNEGMERLAVLKSIA